MSRPIRLAVTPGEPAGIGPDLVVRLAQAPSKAELVAVADPGLLAARARTLGLDLLIHEFDPQAASAPSGSGHLTVQPLTMRGPVEPGRPTAVNAAYVLETLAAACDGCLAGTFEAMVTGPVHKGVINDAGLPFSGHTEFLAERCGGEPVMMLVTPGLRVALATTHLPLSQVSKSITRTHLARVIGILNQDLVRRFGIGQPRILVCGLNPHAGEGGHLGQEEIQVIAPVVRALCETGLQLIGPLAADTAFVRERLADADAVLAMYHDQGLPVLKHLGFGRAVNVTLGLPIIRTSVDHGTALDRAGTNTADLGSLEAAIEMARELARGGGGRAE